MDLCFFCRGDWWGRGEGLGCALFSKGHAEDSEKPIEGDGHYGLLSKCSSSDVKLMKAIKNVAPNEAYTRLASCPENRYVLTIHP